MKSFLINFHIFILIFLPSLYSQTGGSLFLRNDTYLSSQNNIHKSSAGRFMPVFSIGGLNDFYSPADIKLNDSKFNILPLNFNSTDLVPVDLLTMNNISKSKTALNIKTGNISDSLKILTRFFTGSETGDPLIHKYTLQNSNIINKNKIVPSAVFSIENGNNLPKYRFTAGYFGYYLTNSSEKKYLSDLSPYFFQKQNKQVLLTGKLVYPFSKTQKLFLNSNFISYYGFDITPFTGSFNHFESYIHRIQFGYENEKNGFKISFIKDGSINEVNELANTPPAKFNIDDYKLDSEWKLLNTGNNNLTLKGEAGVIKADNLPINYNNEFQKIFSPGSIDKFYYNISFFYNFNLYKKLSAESKISFDKWISARNALSGYFNFNYKINDKNNLKIKLSSPAKFPSIAELHGNFYNYSLSKSDSIKYQIKGNKFLAFERINSFELLYIYRTKSFDISVSPFYSVVENPITQRTIKIFRFQSSGQINRKYLNDETRKLHGIESSLLFRIINKIRYSSKYRYTGNNEVEFYPAHRFISTLDYKLTESTNIFLKYVYKSKTIWKEYLTGFDESVFKQRTISSSNSVDLSLTHQIINFYGINNIFIQLFIENIFNNKLKYHPAGNDIGRTIYLSCKIDI